METTYRIRRVKDGKFANQTRFFGKTSWGRGQTFVQLKAAKKNFRDLVFKRETNFPWKNKEAPEKHRKRQPKTWGKLQLIKTSINTNRGIASETILMEA